MNVATLGESVRRLWARDSRSAPSGSKVLVGPSRGRAGRWSGRGRPGVTADAELRLYDEMRRSFPLLDVAVTRLVQLCGHPLVEAPSGAQDELTAWMKRLPAGPGQAGLGSWVETQLDHMLVYGRGVGEVILTPSRREVAALLTLHPGSVRLEADEDPLGSAVRFFRTTPEQPWPTPMNAATTLLSLRAPQGGLEGTSLLRSLPFVAEASSIIENATAQVWQRMGSPSFHINWTEPEAPGRRGGEVAEGALEDLERSFSDMMRARRDGGVKDWFTSGPVSVELMGSPEHVAAVQESQRVFAEQMVAATGLPSWLLGLHWSTTERLSVQQADMLVAHIEGLRREIQPCIEYVVDLRQRLVGRRGLCRVTWPAVNLRDATEQARAAAWREQARQRRIENARRMWELGFWTQERAARDADDAFTGVARPFAEPPSGLTLLPQRLTPVREDE